MSNEKADKKIYDLKERTTKFGNDSIDFVKKLKDNYINRPIAIQFIRSATSIGANYMEADGAESKNDFFHKISICRKESKETIYWLDMIFRANQDKKNTCEKLKKEASELTLIFSSIIKNRK